MEAALALVGGAVWQFLLLASQQRAARHAASHDAESLLGATPILSSFLPSETGARVNRTTPGLTQETGKFPILDPIAGPEEWKSQPLRTSHTVEYSLFLLLSLLAILVLWFLRPRSPIIMNDAAQQTLPSELLLSKLDGIPAFRYPRNIPLPVSPIEDRIYMLHSSETQTINPQLNVSATSTIVDVQPTETSSVVTSTSPQPHTSPVTVPPNLTSTDGQPSSEDSNDDAVPNRNPNFGRAMSLPRSNREIIDRAVANNDEESLRFSDMAGSLLDMYEDRMSEATYEQESLKREIARLQADLATEQEDHQGEIARLHTDLAREQKSHQEKLASLQADLTTQQVNHREEIASLQADLNTKQKNHQEELACLQADLATERESHQKEIANLQVDLTTKQENYREETARLQADLTTAQQQIQHAQYHGFFIDEEEVDGSRGSDAELNDGSGNDTRRSRGRSMASQGCISNIPRRVF